MSDGKFKEKGTRHLTEVSLDLMRAVEEECVVSQRNLAHRLGVALGLTNLLVKRFVKKGFLKVKDAPARRFAYYLTPKGFQEKSSLTAEYLSDSLNFFRIVRVQYADGFTYCANRGWKNIALYGTSDLTDIAILAAQEIDVNLIGIVASDEELALFNGRSVVQSLEDLASVDAIFITDIQAPQFIFDMLKHKVDTERIITPDILHVSRVPIIMDEGNSR